MGTVSEAVRDLYRARWGEPLRTAQFERNDRAITVGKWLTEGVAIYATVGASEYASGSDHRVEFFCGLRPEQDDVASPLAALGIYSAEQGVRVGHGHTVPAGACLWPGTEMRRFLVARPLSGYLESVALAGGVHIEFLQAIPIYESEAAEKREAGVAALLARWEEQGVPFWDSARQPAT